MFKFLKRKKKPCVYESCGRPSVDEIGVLADFGMPYSVEVDVPLCGQHRDKVKSLTRYGYFGGELLSYDIRPEEM